MRSYIYSGALLVVLMLHTAWAQAPAVIGYQGVLTDGSGTAVADGTHTLSFGLYEMASGGIAVWTESQTVATVNGVFHANLGSASPLGIDFDRALWLGIGVDGGAELSPRLALTGSPYSLIARSVADGAVTGGKIADGAVSAADLADDAVTTSRVADGAITSAKIADGSIRAVDVAGGEMVTGVNGLQDGVTLAAGANVTITPSGNTLTIASAGGSGGGGLADGSVTSAKIADGGVGTVDLASAAVSAAKLADVHEMILSLPDGYETQIGEAGGILSGGQRQRIALARALFGAPTLLVLDEPNASLDRVGEQALLDTIDEMRRRGVTIVVIAHRPSMLEHVDKILVLRDGKTELYGTRDEVMAKLTGRPDPATVTPDQVSAETRVIGGEQAPAGEA